eukprot:TRINITY_DN10865_c0_g1_i4.p1 TRINITY_DN10865_c0_g1~~TRINITY_DN10865_c0_g1_i4.p1  ORF type:complete len:100 (+),score=22.23 TRINITY_DN10865_c0_g1_i4:144-443(+)
MLKMLAIQRQFLIWKLHGYYFGSQVKSEKSANKYVNLCEEDIEQLKSLVNLDIQLSVKISTAKKYYSNYISAKFKYLSLIHICRCRRIERCRSRWSPYH